jgi:hypothetical protein
MPQSPPRTEEEQYLAKLWEELLRVDRVDRSDNFFLLGGTSMLLFSVQRRIGLDRGVFVDYSDLLSVTQLDDLASLLRRSAPAAE